MADLVFFSFLAIVLLLLPFIPSYNKEDKKEIELQKETMNHIYEFKFWLGIIEIAALLGIALYFLL